MQVTRQISRAFVLTAALLATWVAGTATAQAGTQVEKLVPVHSTATKAIFDVRSLRTKVIKSAKVAVGRSHKSVSKRQIRRAARAGVLRVSFSRKQARVAKTTRRKTFQRHRAKRTVRLEIRTRAIRRRAPSRSRTPSAGTVAPVVGRTPNPPRPTAPSAPGDGDREAPPSDDPDPTPPPAAVPVPPTPAPTPASDRVEITGRTFYVSPSGDDSNSGLSPSSAWRTVTKVNRASLTPGDGVLFEGGATFSQDSLMPSRSGSAGKRIVYGSYGNGRAALPKGIWIRDTHWIAFQDLIVTGTAQGIVASAGGSGCTNIDIRGMSITDVGIGINAANAADRSWQLIGNTIARTQDSGVIVLGSGHLISGNSISENALDRTTSHGKHGVYLKSADSTVVGNSIHNFGDSGVSARYRNSRIERNTFANGGHAIAWHQYDTVAGISYWRDNVIQGTTAAGIYVSPSDVGGSTRESFHISGNDITISRGRFLDLRPTSGAYSVSDNLLR